MPLAIVKDGDPLLDRIVNYILSLDTVTGVALMREYEMVYTDSDDLHMPAENLTHLLLKLDNK